MKSGCKILWTDHALKELAETYEYLELHFTDRELKRLSNEIDKTLELISKNPCLFQMSNSKGIRKVVILKFNTIYYREKREMVEILSFFSNRKNPDKREI